MHVNCRSQIMHCNSKQIGMTLSRSAPRNALVLSLGLHCRLASRDIKDSRLISGKTMVSNLVRYMRASKLSSAQLEMRNHLCPEREALIF